jgi:hypothetical protein
VRGAGIRFNPVLRNERAMTMAGARCMIPSSRRLPEDVEEAVEYTLSVLRNERVVTIAGAN